MILDLTEVLDKGKKNIANQFKKSSTSISNISEAGSSESINDLLHKLKIASKESNETFFWLKLLRKEKQQKLKRNLSI
jgi:four helix bundle protein